MRVTSLAGYECISVDWLIINVSVNWLILNVSLDWITRNVRHMIGRF